MSEDKRPKTGHGGGTLRQRNPAGVRSGSLFNLGSYKQMSINQTHGKARGFHKNSYGFKENQQTSTMDNSR